MPDDGAFAHLEPQPTRDGQRFGEVDLPDRLAPWLSPLSTQMAVALLCAVGAVVSRIVVDVSLTGAGPFALTFPFVLFATLFARWLAGAATMVFCALYAWYFVLPAPGSFEFVNPSDGPRVVVNVLSGFLIVALAEYFRRTVRRALQERDAIAEERRLFLDEIDHRVKNNFAMVGALIRMEMRGAGSEDVRNALQMVRGRVESIARAHQALYRGHDGAGTVSMRPYLVTLCRSLTDGFLDPQSFPVRTRVEDVALERDKAISIGLVVNELCTNAAKHAFVGRDRGEIVVSLAAEGTKVVVVVEDDGVGFPEAPARAGSLGQSILDAFAQQAGGRLERLPADRGAKFKLSVAR